MARSGAGSSPASALASKASAWRKVTLAGKAALGDQLAPRIDIDVGIVLQPHRLAGCSSHWRSRRAHSGHGRRRYRAILTGRPAAFSVATAVADQFFQMQLALADAAPADGVEEGAVDHAADRADAARPRSHRHSRASSRNRSRLQRRSSCRCETRPPMRIEARLIAQ